MVTREVDPTANEEARVQYVMKGYRADTYTQVETLVYMAFTERTHAVFCRNLAAQLEEPILAGLIDRIARDEARHEEFFSNLVAHCLEYTRDETIAAIAARAADLERRRRATSTRTRTRCRTSPTPAFSVPHSCARRSPTASPHGVSPTSPSCGNSSSAKPTFAATTRLFVARSSPASARLRGGQAATRVASFSMASDMLCCQGGTSRHYDGRTGPGPGAAVPADMPVRVRAGLSRSRSAT